MNLDRPAFGRQHERLSDGERFDDAARMAGQLCRRRLRELEEHRFRSYLISEGMVLLASKKTPMYIQDRLNSFLQPETREGRAPAA